MHKFINSSNLNILKDLECASGKIKVLVDSHFQALRINRVIFNGSWIWMVSQEGFICREELGLKSDGIAEYFYIPFCKGHSH
jgi:hypothetical protein